MSLAFEDTQLGRLGRPWKTGKPLGRDMGEAMGIPFWSYILAADISLISFIQLNISVKYIHHYTSLYIRIYVHILWRKFCRLGSYWDLLWVGGCQILHQLIGGKHPSEGFNHPRCRISQHFATINSIINIQNQKMILSGYSITRDIQLSF